MPTFAERLAAGHATPEYQNATPDQRAAMDARFAAKIQAEGGAPGAPVTREQARNNMLSQLQAANGSDLVTPIAERPGLGSRILANLGQSISAGASGAANSMTLGYAPQLESAMSGGAYSAPELQGREDALAAEHPTAYGVGRVAGSFVGPVAKVAGKIASAAGLPVGRLVGAGVQPLESEFAKRMLTNLAQNAAGGATATFAADAAQHRDDDPTLPQRLADAAYNTGQAMKSPVGLGLLTGGSYLQTKLTPPANAELAKAVDRYERVTGQRVPIETLTDSAEQQRFYDAAARVPGVADRVEAQRTAAIKGLSMYLDDIGSQVGAAPGRQAGNADRAAAAVRNAIGTRENPGPITAMRRGTEARALATSGANPSSTALDTLKQGVDTILADRPAAAESEMDAVFRKIQKFGDVGGIDARNLEELRQQTASLAQFSRNPPTGAAAMAASRTTHEASRFYDTITTAIQQASPEYSNALGVAKGLRRMEDALGDVPVRSVNDAQAAAFFSGFSKERWNALAASSAPEDIAALKGWYYGRLVSAAARDSNAITPRTLDRLVSQPNGPFNRQIVDTVLPGALPELRDYAAFSSKLMGKGRFQAEGSQTFGRGMRAVTAGGIPAAVAITGILSNPFRATAAILTPIGAKLAIRSAMGGVIEGTLQKAARAGASPFGPSALAANQAIQRIPQPFGTGPRILSSLPGAVSPGAGGNDEGPGPNPGPVSPF